MSMSDSFVGEILNIVREAGDLVLGFYDKNKYLIKEKNNNTPVTEADLASHDFLIKKLEIYGYPILSEEGRHFQHSSDDFEYMWIIDPLDGTKDFIQRTEEFCIMVGLVNSVGRAIFGAVYVPCLDKMYYAQEGHGAFLKEGNKNVFQINVSKKKIFGGTILVSRNHLGDMEQTVACENNMVQKSMGSAGLKMCHIAQGSAELYINSSSKSGVWDVCAADVILRESEGSLTDLSGDVIIYNHKNPILKNGYIAKNSAEK